MGERRQGRHGRVSTDLAQTQSFLDVTTGELLPATVDNAAQVIQACRLQKDRLNDLVAEATRFLVDQAAVQGTKTLGRVTLSGGPAEDYDAADLMEALRAADCPEARIEEAVVAHITYKVNRSVLRQLAAANPDYKAAIELARRDVERAWRVAIK